MKFSELSIGDIFTTYEVYLNLNTFYEKTDFGSASITIHGNEIRVPFSQDTIVYPISTLINFFTISTEFNSTGIKKYC